MPDRGHHGEGEHHQGHVTVPAMPGSALVVIDPNSFLAVSKLSSIAHRWPSTATSFQLMFPLGTSGEEGEVTIGDATTDQ